ncbi:MAG: tetratricopeptide repeat protein [Bryobacteraceae bacterium]
MRLAALFFALAALSLSQARTPHVTPHIGAAQAAYEEGKAARLAKQFQRAAECFRKAIEIEPTFLDAHEALIADYLDSGRRLDAAASITQFLEIQPDVVHYRVLLGQILLEQKQAERALAQFSLALKRDPYNADGLLGFATAARAMGMRDRAAEAIERGRKRYPLDERFKTVPGNGHQ